MCSVFCNNLSKKRLCKRIYIHIYMYIYTDIKNIYAAATSLQLCLTLCDPMACSLPGVSIPGILQSRTLEWVTISFSNAWKWNVKVKSLSRVWLLATPWTAAHQVSPSMGFSGQQYWSGVPLPSSENIYVCICVCVYIYIYIYIK